MTIVSTAELRRTNMAVPVDACVEGSVRRCYLVLLPISLRYSTRQPSLFQTVSTTKIPEMCRLDTGRDYTHRLHIDLAVARLEKRYLRMH